MKLLIDIGNTRAKWALADPQIANPQIIVQGEASDWSALAKHQESIECVWASCVGQASSLKRVAEQIKGLIGLELNLAKVTSRACGLVNQYRDLDKLGVDRWVAAVGARVLHPSGALIVVDVGTAVTIDCIDNEHNYQGGVILPGFAMMHDSLVGRTAGIESQRQEISTVIGKTTQECVNAGAHFGLVGAIERIISEMQAQLNDSAVSLLITGGDAKVVTRASHLSFEHHATLLFDGLLALSQHA